MARLERLCASKEIRSIAAEHEHELLSALKQRAKKLGREFKKSEILRAGVAHLVAMADAALMAALAKVERVKTGRPAKKGKKK